MSLFPGSLIQATDDNGAPVSGAKWHFYMTGTTTPLAVYSDADLTTPLGVTVTADAGGRFDPIYLDDALVYRAVLKTSAGATIGGQDIDPVNGGTATALMVTPLQFGAVGDGTTDDSAAFVAAIAYLKGIAGNDDVYYKGSPKLIVPAGAEPYNLGTTTLDITHTMIIEGEGSMNGYASRLSWSGDCDGIRIQAYNTTGATAVNAAHYSGSYTIIRNLGLVGPYVNNSNFTGFTEGDYHGIRCRSNYVIEDCLIDGFAGDGIHSKATSTGGAGEEGNSNCSFISRVKVTNVRNGVYLDGADANACTIIGVIGVYCRQYTVWDSSFLGNTHIGHHSANSGLVRGVPASVVSYSGNRYFVIQGQAVGASTNAPSGTTADNAYWAYLQAGAADTTLNIPTWISGVSVREGGSYKTDSANAYNTFMGCYSEGGEAAAQFISPTLVVGGLFGTRDPITTGNYIAGGKIRAVDDTRLGQTRIGGTNANVLTAHNKAALGAGVASRVLIAQGYEADGTTPHNLASIYAASSTSDPATSEATVYFGTRTYTGGGTLTDRVALDGGNAAFRPVTDNTHDSGLGSFRWKISYSYIVDAKTEYRVNGTKVIGAQGASVADATDAASAITQLNALLARCRAHGLIA